MKGFLIMKQISIILFVLLFFNTFLFSQEESPNQTSENPAEQNVIDLTSRSYSISARMELPQVRIFDKRITPDFKEVNAEKSFANELKIGSENIKFEPITSGKVEPIPNIEELLKKKRY
jgi:hypothetical protein